MANHLIRLAIFCLVCVKATHEALTAQANVNEEVAPPHEIVNLARDREFSRFATKSTIFTILGDPSGSEQQQGEDQPVNLARLLSIDPTTGVVRAGGRIDREQLCAGKNVNPCSKSVDISLRRNESSSSGSADMIVGTLTLHIYDVNDIAPSFSRPSEAISVSESARVGDVVATFRANDADFGENSVKAFQIYDDAETFEVKQSPIDTAEVQVLLRKPLDREQNENYRFQIRAVDGAGLEGVLTVNVTVGDDNDNSPEFSKQTYTAELVENRSYKEPVVTVKATDRDDGVNSQIIYKIDDAEAVAKQYFYVHHSNGGISTLLPLDYETNKEFRFKVLAVDNLGRGRTSSATVVVSVADVNDNPPTITIKTIGDQYTESTGKSGPILPENLEPNREKPKTLALVMVRDPDTGGGGEVTCSINTTDFALEPMGPKTFRIIPKKSFDREKTQEVPVEIACADKGKGPHGGPLSATKTVVIRIGDVNDNAPTFFNRKQEGASPFSVNISENNPPGYVVAELVAEDLDIGENAKITYELRPETANEYFEIVTSDNRGLLKAKRSFDYEKIRKVAFEILAIDRGQPPLTGSTDFEVNIVNVNDNLPTFQRPSYVFFVRDGSKQGTRLGEPVLAIDADEEIPADSSNQSAVRYFLSGDDLIKRLIRLDEVTGQVLVATPEIKGSQFEATGGRITFTILAGDSQNRAAFSRVTASLYVVSPEQTGPIVLFPNMKNDTVILSAPIGAGVMVSRIVAFDVDDATSPVSFKIRSIEPPLGDIDIDPKTGILSLTDELIAIESVLYDLTVLIKNKRGETTQAVLKLFVSPDKNAIEAFAKTAFVRDGRNLTIVIILCCASGAISIIIITVIVLVKRRDRNNRTYNARKAAEKKLKELGFEAASPPAGDQASLARNISTANGSGDTSVLTPTSGHRQPSIDNEAHLRNTSPSDHSSDHTVNTTSSSLVNSGQQPSTPGVEAVDQTCQTLPRQNGGVKFQLQSSPQQQISPANSSDGEGSAATTASGLTATSGLSGSDKTQNECPIHSQKSILANSKSAQGLLQPHLEHHMSNERLRAFFADPHHQQILSARSFQNQMQPGQPPPHPTSFLINGNGTCVERARIVQTNIESPPPRIPNITRNNNDSMPRQVTWAQMTSEMAGSRSSSVQSGNNNNNNQNNNGNCVTNAALAYSLMQQQQQQYQQHCYDSRIIPPGYGTLSGPMHYEFQKVQQQQQQQQQQVQYPSSTLVMKSAMRPPNNNASPSLDSLARQRSTVSVVQQSQLPPPPQNVTFASRTSNVVPSAGNSQKVQLSEELLRTQNLEMVV